MHTIIRGFHMGSEDDPMFETWNLTVMNNTLLKDYLKRSCFLDMKLNCVKGYVSGGFIESFFPFISYLFLIEYMHTYKIIPLCYSKECSVSDGFLYKCPPRAVFHALKHGNSSSSVDVIHRLVPYVQMSMSWRGVQLKYARGIRALDYPS